MKPAAVFSSVIHLARLACGIAACVMVGTMAPKNAWADQSGLKVGRAVTDITPTEDTGGVKPILDALRAKALVMQHGDTSAAIVVLDLPVVNRPAVEEIRQRVAERTEIPGAHVMISATHTHTGLTPGWDGVPLRDRSPRPSPPAENERYRQWLIDQTTEAVVAAWNDRQPASVSAGIGQEPSLPFHRRFLMKNGTVVFNPGIVNPEIVRPVGPIDPAVPVVLFSDAKKTPLATMVNYAMHSDTVGGEVYSADYPFMLGRCLSDVHGDQMMTMFSIGTAGNINHIDVTWPIRQKGIGEANRIGVVLAAEVLRTFRKLEPVDAHGLRVAQRWVDLPAIKLEPGDSERADSLAAAQREQGTPLNLLERVFMQRVRFAQRQQGKPLKVEVQVITLGNDLAWVGLPGEVFVELGMLIKQGSPYRVTMVHELANDWIRYVPNRKGFHDGSYEAINSRCGPGGGEAMANAAIDCLLSLQTVPQQSISK